MTSNRINSPDNLKIYFKKVTNKISNNFYQLNIVIKLPELFQDPKLYMWYLYLMYQLSLDQLHSSQMMLMEHKSLNFCSNNTIKQGIFKYYNL